MRMSDWSSDVCSSDLPPLRPRPIATMKDMGMDMSGMQGMEGMDMSAGMGSTRGVDPTAEQNASGKLATGVAAAVAYQTGIAGMDHFNMQGMPGDSGIKQGMDHSAIEHGDMAGHQSITAEEIGSVKIRAFSN